MSELQENALIQLSLVCIEVMQTHAVFRTPPLRIEAWSMQFKNQDMVGKFKFVDTYNNTKMLLIIICSFVIHPIIDELLQCLANLSLLKVV